jgi:hypothetical protein
MNIQPARFRLKTATQAWQPQRVLLFSGHMIDAPDRKPPRFPADKESIVAQHVAATLDQLHAGPDDLALTQGTCGDDILFAEACQQRGVKLQLLQPFIEADFIANSVIAGGADWLKRYHAITAVLDSPPLVAPTELGELPPAMNAYERCNLLLLSSALNYGAYGRRGETTPGAGYLARYPGNFQNRQQ